MRKIFLAALILHIPIAAWSMSPAFLGALGGNAPIYESTITAGDLHIATKDGEAMMFHDTIDFTNIGGVDYSGTDAGSTPYRFVFTDSTGKTAIAYGGAAGGGEALGAELLSGWNFTSGWTGILGGSIVDADTWASSVASGAIFKAAVLTVGRLYKARYAGTVSAGTSNISDGATRTPYVPINSGYGFYSCRAESGSTAFLLENTAAATTDVTTLEFFPLTDIPATGLHLMSAENGTTRNMASMETGFNQNAITKVEIYD